MVDEEIAQLLREILAELKTINKKLDETDASITAYGSQPLLSR